MEAFENAIAVDMAIGSSTNTVLHLPAIAHEAGINLPLEKFDEISRRNCVYYQNESRRFLSWDLDEAGSICAVMKELTKLGLIHAEQSHCYGNGGGSYPGFRRLLKIAR